MKRTGIFFTYFQGERLRDFPQALEGLLCRENIFYYDALYESTDGLFYLEPAGEQELYRVHSREMVARVMRTGDFESAAYSAGGTVHAAREIAAGRIDNAFIFTSFGDHHAGKDFFGGMCYFNGAAMAVADLKTKGMKKFAIVDTDAHHADGTRDIFANDESVLHVCCCWQDYADGKNNVDIKIPYGISDEEFLNRLGRVLEPLVLQFQPEIIFWEYGYDATRGEYGDKGLSPDCHPRIASLIKSLADRTCQGRLVSILCGGSGRSVARYTIPKIIGCLAEVDRI